MRFFLLNGCFTLCFYAMLTFQIDFLMMNIKLFSNPERRLNSKQILERHLLRQNQHTPSKLEAKLQKISIQRSTIYPFIYIHTKKSILSPMFLFS